MNPHQSLQCLLDRGFINQDRFIDMSRSISALPQDRSSLYQLLIANQKSQSEFTITITAPDGVYSGATIQAEGGCPVIWDIEVESEYEGFEDGNIIYRFYKNGIYTGEFAFGEEGQINNLIIPDGYEEGDILTIQDYCGNISNELIVEEDFILSAPDAVYAGSDTIVSGGQSPYMFIINGVETGEWFESPTTFPDDLEEGDTVQVKDTVGRLSNILVAIPIPTVEILRRQIIVAPLTAYDRPVMSSPPTRSSSLDAPVDLTKLYAPGATYESDSDLSIWNEIGRFVDTGGGATTVRVWSVTQPSGGNLANGRSSTGLIVDCFANCDSIAFRLTTAAAIGIEVDGQFAQSTNYTLVTNPNPPYSSWLRLDFGSVAERRIRLHTSSVANRTVSIAVAPAHSIRKPDAQPLRLQFFGDSHSTGTGQTFSPASYPRVLAALIGNNHWISSGIGGTGMVNPGSAWKFGDHIADIRSPHVLVIQGSRNDGGSLASVKAECLALLAAARSNAPDALIILTGVVGGLDSSQLAVENQLKLAFDDWSDGNKLWLPCMTSPDGPHFNAGNIPTYITGDGVHMNNAGHIYQARMLLKELKRALDIP